MSDRRRTRWTSPFRPLPKVLSGKIRWHLLKAELKRADLTYEDLAERLRKHGFKETKASIANKLARATLPAHFFLAALAAMGRDQIALAEI